MPSVDVHLGFRNKFEGVWKAVTPICVTMTATIAEGNKRRMMG